MGWGMNISLPRPVDLLNTGARLAGITVTRGLSYGALPRQKLDIYAPQGAGNDAPQGAAGRPVILFLYGGSWQTGARADYRFIGARFAALGYVTVAPDYRVYPEVCYPGFVEDTLAAARWAAANIGAFGGDAEAMFLLGHSAGAYNAVMAGLHPAAPRLKGVIGLAGPYDFLPIKDKVLKIIFGTAADIRETQPVRHVHSGAPPMFLAAGGADRTVMPRNTTVLAARLRAAGAVVETRIYPGIGHIGILTALLPYLAWRAPVLADTLAFIAACLGGEYAALERDDSPSTLHGST